LDVRISIFLDDQRTGGMTDKDRQQSPVQTAAADKLFNWSGELSKARAVGMNRKDGLMSHGLE